MFSAPQRIQFSIRTLLGVMSLVAVGAAVCGWWIHTSRQQRQAIDVIASKGGFVWIDRAGSHIDIEFGVPLHETCGQIQLLAGPRIRKPTFADDDLEALERIWRLRNVSFANTNVSSLAIEEFRESHPRMSISR